MDEFKEELSAGQRLTEQDVLELHTLMEQASHEIRQHRPHVSFEVKITSTILHCDIYSQAVHLI